MELTARQAEFADAALRIVAAEGLPAVTFRAVAAEAGCSLGAVQKAFATKEQLVGALFHRFRLNAVGPALDGEPGRPDLHTWLSVLMLAMLPLDDARRGATVQGAAFSERAIHDAAIGDQVAASDGELRRLIGLLVGRARAEGAVAGSVDPAIVASSFLALAEGWSLQLLYAPRPEAEVSRDVSYAVRCLLTG